MLENRDIIVNCILLMKCLVDKEVIWRGGGGGRLWGGGWWEWEKFLCDLNWFEFDFIFEIVYVKIIGLCFVKLFFWVDFKSSF